MDKIKKKIRTFFGVGLALLIGLPAGIVMTVFGATKSITALLVIGIVLIVAGFYAGPVLLVQVGEKKKLGRVIAAVENQNLYTAEEIAAGTGIREKAVLGYVNEALQKGYLTGYKWENGRLELIRSRKQTWEKSTVKCPFCGAPVAVDPQQGGAVCPYCGAHIKDAEQRQ